ncbi:MAG: SDR family NAD(P)-dependent oxidoreductase, partial [Rhodomicrobium sp.]
MNNLFVFGLGYSASAIGALLEQTRWQVLGTARSAAKFEALKAQGLTPVLFSDADGIARALANAT